MGIETTIAFLVLIVMQSYVMYPASWKTAWRYIKGWFGA